MLNGEPTNTKCIVWFDRSGLQPWSTAPKASTRTITSKSCSFSISDDHPVTLYLSRCQVMTSTIWQGQDKTNKESDNSSSNKYQQWYQMNRINKHFYNSLFIVQSQLSFICSNRIFDVIVRVRALGAVDHGLEPWSVKPDYTFGICWFSVKRPISGVGIA
jgi:hypothetical protein